MASNMLQEDFYLIVLLHSQKDKISIYYSKEAFVFSIAN